MKSREELGDANATARTRRSSQRRLVRTIVLGAVAVFAAIIWLASELGIEAEELAGYALTSLLLVLAMAVLGLGGAALLRALARLRRR